MFSSLHQKKGATLLELLVALIIIVLAAIASLSFFSLGLGNMGKQGNRRAALERARERLEQLMQTNISSIKPSDTAIHWLTCTAIGFNPCASFNIVNSLPNPNQTVDVDDLPTQKIEMTVQFVNDTTNDTGGGTPVPDTLELGVKVWFTSDTAADNDFNRVYIRTLRTP